MMNKNNPWYENLIYDAIKFTTTKRVILTPDQTGYIRDNIERIINIYSPNPTTTNCILSRYKDGKKLEDVGKEFGISAYTAYAKIRRVLMMIGEDLPNIIYNNHHLCIKEQTKDVDKEIAALKKKQAIIKDINECLRDCFLEVGDGLFDDIATGLSANKKKRKKVK